MRVRLLALAIATVISGLPALAADYPLLRGTNTPSLPPAPKISEDAAIDWNGLYIGAYGAYSASTVRARNMLQPLVADALMGTGYLVPDITAGNRTSSSAAFGAFAGYNLASPDALLGLEADIGMLSSRTNVVTSATPAIGGLGLTDLASASSQTRIDQMFSVRGRAGLIYGNIMPYVTGGLAWGYGSTREAADIRTFADPMPRVANAPILVGRNRTVLLSGFTAGAGIEARYGSLLLRGEYLFTTLGNSRGSGSGRVDINQGRLAAGVAF